MDSWTTRRNGARRRPSWRSTDGPSGIGRDVLCQMRVEPAFSPPLEDVEEEEELVCPISFLEEARRPKGNEKKGLINYTEGRSSAVCVGASTTSTRAAGCRDTSYHRAVAQGEVDPVEAFAPKVEAPP